MFLDKESGHLKIWGEFMPAIAWILLALGVIVLCGVLRKKDDYEKFTWCNGACTDGIVNQLKKIVEE